MRRRIYPHSRHLAGAPSLPLARCRTVTIGPTLRRALAPLFVDALERLSADLVAARGKIAAALRAAPRADSALAVELTAAELDALWWYIDEMLRLPLAERARRERPRYVAEYAAVRRWLARYDALSE